ncbi:MAG: peptidase M28 [Flammeovirgaceae bacterium]|nr:peptidase M28 [Flammeovirgaceae bacterium]MBE61968.1 peptidase M28 [Flammeovirgaceae bacterium]|tara:strand:- start:1968 stop:3590 length:1623 start_codon:yes stop_codon:yes gene_type:complete
MKKLTYLSLIAALIGCQPKESANSEADLIDTVAIARHIEILASDEFLGRKPFTEGEEKTIAYLADQLKSFGLKPGNGNSYFQEVPMVELDAKPSETMLISGGSAPVELKVGDDFVAYSERVEAMNELKDSEIVFAGFGVVAPEYGWNDYEGLDVKGKTVVVLVNDPGFGSEDTTLFKGKTMTYYGRWTYKYEEAARQGAAACLIVHETIPAGYGWSVVRNSWSGASLYLDQTGDAYKPVVQGWITRDAAIKMFEASDVDMKGFVERSRSADFEPIPLNLTASVIVENGIKKSTSNNVIAVKEGTSKPDEYILYSAHWDHLGVGPEVDGDSIYNGAHDNASGTAAVLGIAEAFAKYGDIDRSVVFLLVTAEEQGLLGSKYYAENPIYPVEKTVANLNIDGLPFYGLMKDLTIVGYGQSELDDLAGKLAEQQGRYVIPDPAPGKGYFFRSDHFQFAKVGVPAIFAYGSYEHMTKGVEFIEEKIMEFESTAYHRPADEYADDWELGGIYQDSKLYYEIGLELANSGQWPKWKEGSEFKSIREK